MLAVCEDGGGWWWEVVEVAGSAVQMARVAII